VAASGRHPSSERNKTRGAELARRLKAGRAEKFGQLSIEAFAAEAGVSPNTLRKLESGQANPGIFTVADVAEKLDLVLDDLIAPPRRRSRPV
jgi:transcriptional regulator with XRE-family HTH domain